MEFKSLTENTALPDCGIFPKFLNHLNLSDAAKLLYCYYLNRTIEQTITDQAGRLYISDYVKETAELMCKSTSTIKRLTKELEDCGLLRRSRQRIGKPACVYLNLPAHSETPVI